MSRIIDCKGLACPKPVIMTKKELENPATDEVVTIVDNDAARQNLQKLAESMKCSSSTEEKDGLFYVTIKKDNGLTAGESCPILSIDEKKIVIMVSTDKLGSGDDKLGTALMKSYIYALSESSTLPKTLLFVNGGVKLTTEGSEVIESLKALQEKGVEILSCGTCLDFYGLKEKLLIGTVTNMYTIVERMNNASNAIKL